MPDFIRVRDKSTDIEIDVTPRHLAAFPDSFTKVNSPTRYPDLSGPSARPRPATTRTDKAGQPANPSKES